MSIRGWLFGVVLAALAAPLEAQSLFNAAGIGLPMEAADGRARALGSNGLGLPESSLLPADPAGSARLRVPSGLMVVQPSWVDLTREGDAGHRYFRGSRFPLFAGAYPIAGGMVSLYASSVLDQAYRGERTLDVDIGGDTVLAIDRFDQSGAVSSLSVSYAHSLHGGGHLRGALRRVGGAEPRARVRGLHHTESGASVRLQRVVVLLGLPSDRGCLERRQ
jgi:hypothetical protein